MARNKLDSSGQEQSEEVSSAGGESENQTKTPGGPLAVLLPPDPDVWTESRRLVGDKNLRVEALATCTSQDPVIVLDLLKTSNAMFFAGGKSAITSTRTAIVRLGSDVVIETLDHMKERPLISDESVSLWFEIHRSRCRRTAIICRVLAEALARTLADDCQAAGLLLFTGELVAVAHFKEVYARLAEELSRSGIIYRLAQDHRFDVEKMGLAYLRRYGIPEAIVAAIDREARAKSQDRVIMKPLCMAAAEMVDAFDNNRWEKIAPGKTLPPKSSLRMLQIPDAQYLRIYERCSEYLFSARLLEEKKRQRVSAESSEYEGAGIEFSSRTMISAEESLLQAEIQNLLQGGTEAETDESADISSKIIEREEREQDVFSLRAAKERGQTQARVQALSASREAPPAQPLIKTNTQKAEKVASILSGILTKGQTSEEVLSDLLQMLIDEGPFKKSALIVVSKDRKKALVVAARGPDIGNGQRLTLDDPLSPLAQCFSKIQSFGSRESKNSPFGSKSYALAPIDADHDTPVALYADCGNEGSVPFEARRIFRTVVELINQKLPQIAGGIPIETI